MRLGPQGLLILRQQQGQYYNQQDEPRIPQQLDFVINELVNPSPGTTPIKILSYLAYYYPTIKNEQNIALITFNFLKCPLFFNNGKIISLNDNYRIIEFFNHIILYKFNISLPHLSFDKFYHSLVDGLRSFISSDNQSHWKVVPVISGILSTIHQRGCSKLDKGLIKIWGKLLNTTLCHDRSCMNNFEIISTSLLAASFNIAYLSVDLQHYTQFLADLIYMKKLNNGIIFETLPWKEDPVLKNLSRLASLLRYIIESNTINKMELNILGEKVMWFTENMNKGTHADEELLKTIIFTTIVIFESITNRIMTSGDIGLHVAMSRKFLVSFYNTNFIVDKIGTGGFNAYNFIYYFSIDVLSEHDPKSLEILIMTLMTKIDYNDVGKNVIQVSNLKFLLNLVENVISNLSPRLQHDLLDFVKDLVSTPRNRFLLGHDATSKPIFEAAHSIMLKFLDLKQLREHEVKDYVNLLFVQYPAILSLQQTVICLKKVLSTNLGSYDYLFSKVNEQIIYCSPNSMVEDPKFRTLRGSLVMVQILLLEFCPIQKYQSNLQWCYNLICQIDNRNDVDILKKSLFDTIVKENRIDNQKGELGISFWYQNIEGDRYHL